MTTARSFATFLAVCALTGTAALAADEKKEEAGRPGALPGKAAKQDKNAQRISPQRGAEATSGTTGMSRLPAPVSGSMPTDATAPSGKLGTEPTARGRLGTDPKPGESSSKPPRPN